MSFQCHSCGIEPAGIVPVCDDCGGFVRYEETSLSALQSAITGDPKGVLPDFDRSFSLGEGQTPTVELSNLDLTPRLYGKLESHNPTCSFKDRGSSLLVAAVTDQSTTWDGLVVASTGNTAPSVAAYAARASIPCAVVVPDGTGLSKLSQVAAHDVAIFTHPGSFSDCFQLVEEVTGDRLLNATAVYSANPFVATANRTVAFEIVGQLGEAPDWVTVPVGAGPLLGGTFQGFLELFNAGITDQYPRMLCVQAAGCHPVVRSLNSGQSVESWTDPITTEMGAIADPLVGYPADGERTRQAVIDSGGGGIALDDTTIEAWTDRLAAAEGIYAEPAGAAGVAAVTASTISEDETAVALITGHGLKDSNSSVETESVRTPEDLREAVLSRST